MEVLPFSHLADIRLEYQPRDRIYCVPAAWSHAIALAASAPAPDDDRMLRWVTQCEPGAKGLPLYTDHMDVPLSDLLAEYRLEWVPLTTEHSDPDSKPPLWSIYDITWQMAERGCLSAVIGLWTPRHAIAYAPGLVRDNGRLSPHWRGQNIFRAAGLRPRREQVTRTRRRRRQRSPVGVQAPLLGRPRLTPEQVDTALGLVTHCLQSDGAALRRLGPTAVLRLLSAAGVPMVSRRTASRLERTAAIRLGMRPVVIAGCTYYAVSGASDHLPRYYTPDTRVASKPSIAPDAPDAPDAPVAPHMPDAPVAPDAPHMPDAPDAPPACPLHRRRPLLSVYHQAVRLGGIYYCPAKLPSGRYCSYLWHHELGIIRTADHPHGELHGDKYAIVVGDAAQQRYQHLPATEKRQADADFYRQWVGPLPGDDEETRAKWEQKRQAKFEAERETRAEYFREYRRLFGKLPFEVGDDIPSDHEKDLRELS